MLESKLTDKGTLSEYKRDLGAIREGSSRIATIGRRLQLLYEIRNSDSPATCADPNAVVSTCLQLVAPSLGQGREISLQTDLGEPAGPLAITEIEWQHAILNLLHNAIEAIDEKGTIEVITRSIPKRAMFEITVRDTGHGIKDEHIPRLGDPFFSTKLTGNAKSLGLFTTFEIVRAAHGTHEIKSKLDLGTTVILRIPFASDIN